MTAEPSSLRPRLDVEIVPSVYDRVSAAVLAGILFLGFAFVVLLSIWLEPAADAKIEPPRPETSPTAPIEPDDDKDLVEPGVEDFPEVAVPQLAELVVATSDAVSEISANNAVESTSGNDLVNGPGTPLEPRQPGTLDDTVPAHKRWSIRFQANNIDEYSEQLNFFDIEVAAIHRTRNSIWRVENVAGNFRSVATNRQRENGTLRFQHKESRMKRWDRELCAKAGIELTDTILIQFYPDSARAILEKVEAAELARDQRRLNEVRKTVFNVVKNDDEFAFKVVEFQYRRD